MSYRLFFNHQMNVVSVECMLCKELIRVDDIINSHQITIAELTEALEEIHGEHNCKSSEK